jgi:hypothetical protein
MRLPVRDGCLPAVVSVMAHTDSHWTRTSWTSRGVRDKVGASHLPLPGLMHAFLEAGLALERLTEGGAPIPAVLAIRARKDA